MDLILAQGIIVLLLFAAGASVFSFLNVIVWRVPRGEGFVSGTSYCPACGHRLYLWDMVPIGSWVLLRGRCRYCSGKIPPRDTVVELLGGVLMLVSALCASTMAAAITTFAVFGVLTVISLIDWDTMEIYNGTTACVALLGVLSCFTMPEVGGSVWERLIGALCISVPMWLVNRLIPGAFGEGDVWLMAAAGLLLGWRLTVLAAFLGVLTGGAYGAILLIRKKIERKEHFAFGPFLCFGIAAALVFGKPLLTWYLSLFQL